MSLPCNTTLIICLAMFSEWPPRSTNLRNLMSRQIWELQFLATQTMSTRTPSADPMFLRVLRIIILILVLVDSKRVSTMPSTINHSRNKKYSDSILIKRMKMLSNYCRCQVSIICFKEASSGLKTPTILWTLMTIQRLPSSGKSTRCPSKSSMLHSFKMTFT